MGKDSVGFKNISSFFQQYQNQNLYGHTGLILFVHQWNNTGRGNGQGNEDVNLI